MQPLESDFLKAMALFRNFRLEGVKQDINPWAIRKVLVIGLHMDTTVARIKGQQKEILDQFDKESLKDAQEFMRYLEM